jgi:hypothetical protein
MQTGAITGKEGIGAEIWSRIVNAMVALAILMFLGLLSSSAVRKDASDRCSSPFVIGKSAIGGSDRIGGVFFLRDERGNVLRDNVGNCLSAP